MTAIQFKEVWKSFQTGVKRTTVVCGITLAVPRGSIFGFLGPNGAGKSTSIKLLLNFIRPDKGAIQVKGLHVIKQNFQKHIGYLPETPCFYENLTAMELLWFGGKASGMAPKTIKADSLAILERLKLDHAATDPVRTYSKGMKQRLGLAMALVHDPEIYVLDEPMSGLDPMGRRLITDVILELRTRGKTVFFSSHILSDIERLCDDIAILNKGRLLYSGNVNDLTQQTLSVEDAFIRAIDEDEKAQNG